jgi:Flp pilus assembly protein TadG
LPIDRPGPVDSIAVRAADLRAWLRRASVHAWARVRFVSAAAPIRAGLLADRRGVAAVEFAMLALPFIALLGVVAESGVVVLAQQTLDVSVDRASRLLRTGEFQDRADGSDPAQRLRQLMCGNSSLFFACRDVRLDVTRAETFKGSQVSEPYDTQTRTVSQSFGTQFQCPTGDDVIAIRAAVPILRLFAFLDFTGRRLADNRQLLVSTVIFRAEAYDAKPCQ